MEEFLEYCLDIAVEHGWLTANDVPTLQDELTGQPPGTALEAILTRPGFPAEQFLAGMAREFALELVTDVDTLPALDPALRERAGRDFCLAEGFCPLCMEGGMAVTLIFDPLRSDPLDALAHRLGCPVEPRLARPSLIQSLLHRGAGQDLSTEIPADLSQANGAQKPNSDSDASTQNLLAEMLQSVSSEEPIPSDNKAQAGDGPIIRYVERLIIEAVRRRASDIHLEPMETTFRIRFRVDGRLMEMEKPPKRLQPSILSRIKLMAGMSIAEKRLPQDGRIQLKTPEKELDLRVSSVPGIFGETIVMRLLDKEGLQLGLPELGFWPDDASRWQRLIAQPDGIVLVTGPTGSGKSTTLYACLNAINRPDHKLITVEDPVEYQLSGINQVQVRREIGMTFANALRAMLRQAPNVIMVGEIRDLETAEIAINASLTGHMVFSTLHTNDATSAVSRLKNIGVKPFLIAASLRAALAQRLVRRICPKCQTPHPAPPAEIEALGISPEDLAQARFHRGTGCSHCLGRGYRGRLGLFELFEIFEETQDLIHRNASLMELRREARRKGMRSLREDGIRKALAGQTTTSEVLLSTLEEEN